MSAPTSSGGPCGSPEGDKDCSEILERVFFFIDNELPTADSSQIQHHLDECGPCLQKYDLERTVKTLVQRSCSEHAPETLRDKVLLRIREVQVEITEDATRVTEVTEVRRLD